MHPLVRRLWIPAVALGAIAVTGATALVVHGRQDVVLAFRTPGGPYQRSVQLMAGSYRATSVETGCWQPWSANLDLGGLASRDGVSIPILRAPTDFAQPRNGAEDTYHVTQDFTISQPGLYTLDTVSITAAPSAYWNCSLQLTVTRQ